jgi:DNA-3-methyladenine glycosylase
VSSADEVSGLEGIGPVGGSGLAGVPGLAGVAGKVLVREFLRRPSTEVAPDLLGCVLAHQTAEGLVAVQIVEVEAYSGESDPASHAFRGKTARNAVMYGEPGHAYVYFTYGMHFCVNLVCQPAGAASAILIRAGRVVAGADLALERRQGRSGGAGGARVVSADGGASAGGVVSGDAAAAPASVNLRQRELARGPARLCQALAIDRAQNGADVCDPRSPLQILAPATKSEGVPGITIATGPRVGVRLGAQVEWRYWVAGDDAVSAYRPHIARGRAAGAVTGSEGAATGPAAPEPG